jgi:uncharacterized protein (TIGR00730 family)
MRSYYPLKSFENPEFLHSPEARSVRILAEYFHPLSKLEKEKITDTIVIFGSARIPDPNGNGMNSRQKSIDPEFYRYYEDAKSLAAGISVWSRETANKKERNFSVITGGGPGIMEASNRGASEVGSKSIGLNIELPMEQKPNPYITENLSFHFHYFFMRKFWFLFYARAAIFFPGGFGTMDELFETLVLQQTEAIDRKFPIYLYGREFWENAVSFEYLSRSGMIAREDLELLKIVDSVDEALKVILPALEATL